MKKEETILFSGGIKGAEAEFGANAERHGIEEVNFTFEGHSIVRGRGLRVLNHEEMKIGYNKQRLDFFVYAKENFAVDVFNTYRIQNLTTIINNKLRKYKEYPYKLYLVVTGENIKMNTINNKITNKINKLPTNMKCITFDEFKWECLAYLPPLDIKVDYLKIYSLL